jgi:hypothetical protein
MATRYNKTANSYPGFAIIGALRIWIRHFVNTGQGIQPKNYHWSHFADGSCQVRELWLCNDVQNRKIGGYRYYTCAGAQSRGPAVCKGILILMDKPGHAITASVTEKLLQPEKLRTLPNSSCCGSSATSLMPNSGLIDCSAQSRVDFSMPVIPIFVAASIQLSETETLRLRPNSELIAGSSVQRMYHPQNWSRLKTSSVRLCEAVMCRFARRISAR